MPTKYPLESSLVPCLYPSIPLAFLRGLKWKNKKTALLQTAFIT
nr:MAG TPA: hypothetical protein [Inoviridae sp.]